MLLIRRPGLLGLAAALALLAGWGLWQWKLQRLEAAAKSRGQALFVGQVDLAGRVVGHDLALPPMASRCSNCHRVVVVPAAAPAFAASGAAPASAVLDRASLGQSRARRGGPPSAYDAKRLCLLLRSGRDAADVIVSTNMPRYAVSDRQCADLWSYLHGH